MKRKDIAQRLKIARKEMGLTQRQVALKLGKSRLSIINLEAGKTQITIEELLILSKIYNKPTCYFYIENCEVLDNLLDSVAKDIAQVRCTYQKHG